MTKHKYNERVTPLLSSPSKEQDRFIEQFRKEAIKNFNIKAVMNNTNQFIRERRNDNADDIPVMCTGCFGFFSKKYKTRHQKVYPGNGRSDDPNGKYCRYQEGRKSIR